MASTSEKLPPSPPSTPSTIDRDLDVLLADHPGASDPGQQSVNLKMVGAVESVEGVEPDDDVLASARERGASNGYDRVHAEHVADLAVALHAGLTASFDPRSEAAWSAPRARLLLHAAALLHDIGLSAGYSGHHKHSYRLIKAQPPAGLDERETEIVANIARYHRSNSPRLRHGPFASLCLADRELVNRLSGMLRVADALDRSGKRAVAMLRVKQSGGAIVVEIEGPERPNAERGA